MTRTVQSTDGSTIAHEMTGSGPALIVVGGAFSTRQSARAATSPLAAKYSVFAYDRRGRGDSTDVQPYAVEREVEDLAAVIDAAGGSAAVYGHSSGAILALEAAAVGVPITRLAAYEPPFTAAEPGRPTLDGWRQTVESAVAAGELERAAMLFMEGTGAEPAVVEGMRDLPFWPAMLAIAHTLPYDLALVGSGTVPTERYQRIAVPTLLLHGGKSPSWAGIAGSVIAEAIPGARQAEVAGQDHGADPAVLAPVLIEFFGAS